MDRVRIRVFQERDRRQLGYGLGGWPFEYLLGLVSSSKEYKFLIFFSTKLQNKYIL
jgi:hypothetical protein